MPIQNEKLEKLKSLLKLVDEGISRAEFEASFIKLMEYLKKLEKDLNLRVDARTQSFIDDIKSLQQEFQGIIENAKNESDSTLSGFKRKTIETINSLFIKSRISERFDIIAYETEKKVKEIDARLQEINDFEAPDPNVIAVIASKLAQEGLSKQIPTTDAIIENLLKQGDKIVSGLELRIDDIKDLKEKLEEVKQIKTTRQIFGGGGFNLGAMQQHFIPWTDATGTPNDVLLDFVIGHSPNPLNSLEVMVDNSMLFTGTNPLTDDWTYTSTTHTISFLIAPPTGSKVRYKCLV